MKEAILSTCDRFRYMNQSQHGKDASCVRKCTRSQGVNVSMQLILRFTTVRPAQKYGVIQLAKLATLWLALAQAGL